MPVFRSRVRFVFILASCATAILAASCASGPTAVPPDLSPMILIQRAQDAVDQDKYERAITFYQAVLDRFPADVASTCDAQYSIAFIKYKQKKYDESVVLFKALMAKYQGPDAELLPAQYRVLGEKILAKVELLAAKKK